MQGQKPDALPVPGMVEIDGKYYIEKRIPAARAEVSRKLSGMNLQHVPRIYSVKMEGETAVVLEEYIPGPSLEERMESSSISREEILSLMDSILEAVQELHDAGIIHRDLKPEHILLAGGQIKLIDFDAARIYKKGKETDTEILGTAGYASPEQFGFQQTDARSDIYSLGKILEEMDSHQDFDRVVKRATSLDKKKRYASAEQMRRDLHSQLFVIPGITNPTRKGKIFSWIYILLCVMICWPGEPSESFHHMSLYVLGMFWFLYAALLCAENSELFRRFWLGNYLAARIVYSVLAYLVLMLAGTLLVSWLDAVIPGTF